MKGNPPSESSCGRQSDFGDLKESRLPDCKECKETGIRRLAAPGRLIRNVRSGLRSELKKPEPHGQLLSVADPSIAQIMSQCSRPFLLLRLDTKGLRSLN